MPALVCTRASACMFTRRVYVRDCLRVHLRALVCVCRVCVSTCASVLACHVCGTCVSHGCRRVCLRLCARVQVRACLHARVYVRVCLLLVRVRFVSTCAPALLYLCVTYGTMCVLHGCRRVCRRAEVHRYQVLDAEPRPPRARIPVPHQRPHTVCSRTRPSIALQQNPGAGGSGGTCSPRCCRCCSSHAGVA